MLPALSLHFHFGTCITTTDQRAWATRRSAEDGGYTRRKRDGRSKAVPGRAADRLVRLQGLMGLVCPALSQRGWRLRRMAHSFDPMPVRIKHEGGKVIRVILWSQPRLTVASATGGKSRGVERLNRYPVGSTEAYVHARRGHRLGRLSRNRELDAKRTSHGAIVRAALLEIDDTDYPEGQKHGVVEPAAALQV